MNIQNEYIEEELTISEFAERFLGRSNLTPQNINSENETSEEIDISGLDIEIFGKNLKSGKDEFFKINKFIIKPEVSEYYTDGKLKGTSEHRIIENGEQIQLKNHPDFNKISSSMKVVDFDIEESHNYYANDRLNHNTVSGGKALAYHCSVRVRLNNVGKLKKGDDIIGNECKAVVVKNRMGPPNRQASFNIYYDSGIADYSSWLDVLKRIGAIKQAGAYYKYTDETQGGEQQFQSKDFVGMMQSNATLREKFYQQICDALIMKYKEPNSIIIEEATVDTSEESAGENVENV